MLESKFDANEYKKKFLDDKGINQGALHKAIEMRKFEIELYWKRAAYFWTFIGATFAGFIGVHAGKFEKQDDLYVLLSCLGIIFSFAWMCVNRGSKYWQENWEKHVDLLEDNIIGPLFKTRLTRRSPRSLGEKFVHIFSGPSSLSVSKINQLVSLCMTLIWLMLLYDSLPQFSFKKDVNWLYAGMITVTFIFCGFFIFLGRTYHGEFWHQQQIQAANIMNMNRKSEESKL